MQMKIEFAMDNAAFEPPDSGAEVARILRRLADAYADCTEIRPAMASIMDCNGNRVGSLKVTR